MGAFTKEKGQDVAMAAAALLRESMPYARFILAGDGTLLNDLRRRAPENVVFPGFLSDHAAFFAALDLFIMPSRSEAWGMAALEAMAHGVPVIASDVGGLPEIVEPGNGGWLVPPGDPAGPGPRDYSGGLDPRIACASRAKKRASGRGCFP